MKLEVEEVHGVRVLDVVGMAPVGCETLVLVPTGSLGSSERGRIRPFSFNLGFLCRQLTARMVGSWWDGGQCGVLAWGDVLYISP